MNAGRPSCTSSPAPANNGDGIERQRRSNAIVFSFRIKDMAWRLRPTPESSKRKHGKNHVMSTRFTFYQDYAFDFRQAFHFRYFRFARSQPLKKNCTTLILCLPMRCTISRMYRYSIMFDAQVGKLTSIIFSGVSSAA